MPKKNKITIECTKEELDTIYKLLIIPAQLIKNYEEIAKIVQPLYKTTIDKIIEIENILNSIDEKDEE